VNLLLKFLDGEMALGGVDFEGGGEEPGVVAVVAGGGDEGLNILAETRAAPAEAGIEKARSDAGVEADALHDFGGLGADALADVGDFVGETNFHGEEGVGSVLDHFGGGQAGGDQGYVREAVGAGDGGGCVELLLDEGRIEGAHGGEGGGIGGT